jgi:hypothetical protein
MSIGKEGAPNMNDDTITDLIAHWHTEDTNRWFERCKLFEVAGGTVEQFEAAMFTANAMLVGWWMNAVYEGEELDAELNVYFMAVVKAVDKMKKKENVG